MPDAYERTLPEVFPDFAPGSYVGRRARGLGLDDVQRVPVGRQLGQPCGAARVRVDHPRPREPWRRRAAARRHRVHVEAAGHRLPGPARGARHHAGAAGGDPDRLPGGGLPRRGDRRPHPSCCLPRGGRTAARSATSRTTTASWCRCGRCSPRATSGWPRTLSGMPPKPPTATWLTYLRCHDDIGWAIMDEDAHALGFTGLATAASSPSGMPVTSPAPPPRPGLPVQPRDRRPSHERHGGLARRARGGPQPGGRPGRRGPAPRHALVIGWGGIGPVERRRARPAQRPGVGGRAGPRGRQPWAHRPPPDWARAAARPARPRDRGRARLRRRRRARARPGVGAAPPRGGRDPHRAGRRPGVLVTVREHPWGASSASTT